MKNKKLYNMLIAAMLSAIGIIIPLFSPVKILLEPASFTLASHVAIYIAMFISPGVALSVAAGTTLGFLLAGFPPVVVVRAASHLVFAFVGSYILKKNSKIIDQTASMIIFALLISLLHATTEVLVVMPFYFGGGLTSGYYARGFLTSVILLVGLGTVVHSLIDFAIARVVWKPLRKTISGRYQEKMEKTS